MRTRAQRDLSIIKHRKQGSRGVSPLKWSDGLLNSDTVSKADILNNQLHSVYTKEYLSDMPSNVDSPHLTMKNIHVGSNGVYKLLKGKNLHKAAVPTKFLQDFTFELAPIMKKNYSTFARYWRSTGRLEESIYCSHIYERRGSPVALNYLPVFFTSVSCKVLEHIAHS